MNRTLQAMVMVATLGFFLYRVNTGIYQAERTLSQGEVVYLELAPVDPRSLIQGDYMALDYALERDLFCQREVVVFWVGPVNQMHSVMGLAGSGLHRHAVAQQLVGAQVGLVERDAGGISRCF